VARLVDCMVTGDQHTAADIAPALKTRLQHWRLYDGDVSRVVAATSNNGRNMVNALGRDGLGISPVIGCVAHTINLCVEDGFKVQRVFAPAGQDPPCCGAFPQKYEVHLPAT